MGTVSLSPLGNVKIQLGIEISKAGKIVNLYTDP
jgi:hypothetical protein